MSPRFGTVVLTGATSGIGEATAQRLAGMARTLIVQGPQPEAEVVGVLDGIRGAAADVPSGSYLEGDRVIEPSAAATDAGNRARLAGVYIERLTPFAA